MSPATIPRACPTPIKSRPSTRTGNGPPLVRTATPAASTQGPTTTAKKGGLATQIPVVVILNRFSASGSEVLSAALHDNNRATIVGEKSFGKGTVNVKNDLKDMKQDRREIGQDTKGIRQDRRELRQDRRELYQDRKAGDKDAVKGDLKDLKEDRKDLKADLKDRRQDRRDLRRDRRDLRRDVREKREDQK